MFSLNEPHTYHKQLIQEVHTGMNTKGEKRVHYTDEKIKSFNKGDYLGRHVPDAWNKAAVVVWRDKALRFKADDGDKDRAGKTMGGNRIFQNEVGLGLMRLALPLCPYQSQAHEPACVYVWLDTLSPLHAGLAKGRTGCTGLHYGT